MRQMRKKILLAIILTFIFTAAIAGAAIYFLVSSKNTRIEELEALSASSKAYAFAKDMKANYEITPSDVVEIAIKNTSFAVGGYYKEDGGEFQHYLSNGNGGFTKLRFKKEDLYGRVVKVNVSKNTPILDSLLYAPDEEPNKDERLQEFNFISIPSDLVENDYVDIRIQFPNGQDYSVLVGKKIEKYSGNTTIFMKLNEEEIMKMGSAVIEAYMQNGVKLYATKYTDAGVQLYKEEIVDYVEKYENGIKKAIEEANHFKARRLAVESEEEYQDASGLPVVLETININGVEYATEETYGYIDPAVREQLEKKGNTKESDITVEEISKYSGISISNVNAIKEAIESEDEKALAYYKQFREQTRTQIACTYPVKDEVLKVVRTNPNIVEEIKAEFDRNATISEKYDKYVELEKQYAIAPETSYDGTKTKAEIKAEMDALVEQRTGNVQSNITKEYDEKKARRVEYLQSLVKGK